MGTFDVDLTDDLKYDGARYSASGMVKRTVDDWLDGVNYEVLNDGHYQPSKFALKFANFVKLANAGTGDSHPTPVVHLKMLDLLPGNRRRIANLCSRGLAKTTLFFEYLVLYLAVFGEIDDFGEVDAMIYVSDSMDNGVKSARKNIEFRYHNSPFLQHWIPKATFTDNYLEFENKNGGRLGVKMFGAKALSLDSRLYLASGGITTIEECQVGDVIMGANGKPTAITRKSEIFHKPMYELVLDDGRRLKVSEDHLNQVQVKKFLSEKTFSKCHFEERTLSTLELLTEPMFATDPNGSQRPLLWIQNAKPMEWPENQDLLLDPYTVGVLIGDGSMNRKASGGAPVVLTAHEADWPHLEAGIPYAFGKPWTDPRNPATISRTMLGINHLVAAHGLDTHGNVKRVPEAFRYTSIAQRLAVLQGLMDTDGTCTPDGKASFCSASKGLVEDVMWLVRSLGGTARWVDKGNTRAYQCSLRLDHPLFRLARKAERQRPPRTDKVAIVAINRIADEPSQCIAVDNEERQFVAEEFFRTHNTGLRGTKIFGKRPVLAVLDDLVSDDDSKSKVAMEAIKDTVYKGVDYALDPTRRKIVFNGTPFNKNDILYEAVESGAWYVNVWPVCEKFPCTREEFKGAWEERFTYDFVMEQYNMALDAGKVPAFMQELMLRITSEDDKLVPDGCIRWYSRTKLMQKKSQFNFYITTDFATSESESADDSVISVWAHNAAGAWFWVDGVAERMHMDKSLDHLFRLAQKYNPMGVGIEVTGQQGGFIPWIQQRMMDLNVWFNLASHGNGGKPGIRSQGKKIVRFNAVLPQIKMGMIAYPTEMENHPVVRKHIEQLAMATPQGFKSKHDDCVDTVSQLPLLNAWRPSGAESQQESGQGITDAYWDDPEPSQPGGMSGYVV